MFIAKFIVSTGIKAIWFMYLGFQKAFRKIRH